MPSYAALTSVSLVAAWPSVRFSVPGRRRAAVRAVDLAALGEVDLRVVRDDVAAVDVDVDLVAHRILAAHAGHDGLVRLVERTVVGLDVDRVDRARGHAGEPAVTGDARHRRRLRDAARAERGRDVAARRAVDTIDGALDVDVDHELAADHRQAIERLVVAEVPCPLIVDVHRAQVHVVRGEAERGEDLRQRRREHLLARVDVVRLHVAELGHLADDVRR